ncbi:hypothetical protein QQ045_031553 [Rhodiola kirilowii]
MWRQRSRIEWLKEGDLNTKIFHSMVTQRKKKNTISRFFVFCFFDITISRIKREDGAIITEEIELCQEAVNHFSKIFRTSHLRERPNWRALMDCVGQSVSPENADYLSASFTMTEVQNAVFQMGSTKAPGPDGFSVLFYQESWEFIKDEVQEFALRFLNDGGELERGVNDTNTIVTLIPNTKTPTTFNEYRPISLCNVAIKIITKTLANRLKGVLNECISVSQSVFVPGRLISDNILIAHKLVNHMRT